MFIQTTKNAKYLFILEDWPNINTSIMNSEMQQLFKPTMNCVFWFIIFKYYYLKCSQRLTYWHELNLSNSRCIIRKYV